ncbi:MAG: hypothetical protein KDA17_07155, partial [Candidatus Saccharibacteria bacterium]|nr:hypothetical protein [Candidatus Saccharibacteria bacterium]
TTGTTSVLEDSAWGTLRTTVLQLTNFVVGTSGDDGNLALGASLFTLPAGDLIVEQAVLKGALTADISVTTDTPEMGLGNVVATGVQATLGAVDAGCENIAGPFVATAVDGEDVDDGGATESGLLVQAADSHVVYLNVADGWADVTAAGDVTFTGYVVLKYRMV